MAVVADKRKPTRLAREAIPGYVDVPNLPVAIKQWPDIINGGPKGEVVDLQACHARDVGGWPIGPCHGA